MLRFIFRWLFAKNGWTVNNPLLDQCQHCVMIGAPHTSNWDFVYCIIAFEVMNIPLRFTIKKEWMRFPLSLFVAPLGGVAIDRSPKGGKVRLSMVEAMTNLLKSHKRMALVVTPEGTRKAVPALKTGFYHVAVNAGVPIALGYLDYAKKEAGVGKIIYPSGDMAKDLLEITEFYKGISARYQELNSFAQPGFTGMPKHSNNE
ncbi:MAG TPA: 1-acyl-sn-glycerol-3-phosphate acyltransferase [Luteibaculaceae bacterium]|nr:1-acyl-sn-glycerol-3-phosphate acyltransferase [Luteibaculaceae bacterium]